MEAETEAEIQPETANVNEDENGDGDEEAGSPVVLTVTVTVTLTGRVGRAAVPGLCAELERRLADRPGAAPVECDVGGVDRADLALVEAVARLALVARRAGRRLRLRGVAPELRALLDLVGLEDVVGLAGEVPEVAEEVESPEGPERRVPGPY
ncbi:STAS domain-containing protein [Kitasatospora albolonga]|uniref:STAS domain-containing protein n=1 Tax=Kitasatospora albolonga TaxID=68173 RepID=UPI00269E05A0